MYRVSSIALSILIAITLHLPVAATDSAGCVRSVRLDAEDLARFAITTPGGRSRAVATGPDGTTIKSAALAGPSSLYYFVAPRQGAYQVRVSAVDGSDLSSCSIEALGRVSALARAQQRRPRPAGVEIAKLRRALAAGAPGAVERFWRMAEERGTPLIEPVPGSTKPVSRVLATFLWRGDEHTRGVLVNLPPYSRVEEDFFRMEQVDGTGIWFATVELPARSRLQYELAVNPPAVAASMSATPDENESFFATIRPDPLNRRHWPEDPGVPARVRSNVVEMEGAEPPRWLQREPGASAGRVESRVWKSRVLGNERTISVYMPPNGNKPAGVVVLFDGDQYTTAIPVPVILDNLLAAGRIPPLAAVFIGNAPGARPTELPCNPAFATFVRDELLEWFYATYRVPRDPAHTIVGGSSYGGLAAVYAAIQAPGTFGNVLSQSGSFWWTPPPDPARPFAFDPDAEPNHVAAMILARPPLPVRFYLEAGLAEFAMPGHPGGLLETNRHLRDVLRAKGHQVFYHEFGGGHGALSWRASFPQALLRITDSWNPGRTSQSHE